MKHKYLAQSVRNLRKSKGLSQEELAENAQLSLRTIQRIEQGDNEPTGDTIRRMAQALNVSPERFTEWATVEHKGYLIALNLSPLTGVLFPLLVVVVPLLLWVAQRDKLKGVNQLGKDVLNFQLTWILVVSFGFAINVFVLSNEFDLVVTSSDLIAVIKSMLLRFVGFYYLLLALNGIIILINTYRINKNMSWSYKPKIKFVG